MKMILCERCFDADDLSKILVMRKRTILDLISSGKLKGVRIGRKYHVSEKNVRNFINALPQE